VKKIGIGDIKKIVGGVAHNTTLSNRLCWFDIMKAQAQDVLKSTTNSQAFSNGNIWCTA